MIIISVSATTYNFLWKRFSVEAEYCQGSPEGRANGSPMTISFVAKSPRLAALRCCFVIL